MWSKTEIVDNWNGNYEMQLKTTRNGACPWDTNITWHTWEMRY